MDDKNKDISEILEDFKSKKEKRIADNDKPLEPPKRREDYIDFAKNGEEPSEKSKKQKKTPQELGQEKALKREKRDIRKEKVKHGLKKVKHFIFNKKFLVSLLVIIALIGIALGVGYAVLQSKGAYLKPYESKYPNVRFQVGMQEKYCDMLGENPDTVGYVEIEDIGLKSAVSSDLAVFPYAQNCTKGAKQFNYVVYLNDNSLEKVYSTARGYNSSSGYIMYSDLFNDYSFKVVGAFYTNTDEKDDDGYIFPYNVTEKMTVDSANEYVSRLESRFIYSTGANITRQDTLLTVSCPTDYREGFRFIVIGVLRDSTDSKSTAREKSNVHYPQVIYDEKGMDNPYRFASKWYPEIIVTDEQGNERTVQKTIDDYKKTIDK